MIFSEKGRRNPGGEWRGGAELKNTLKNMKVMVSIVAFNDCKVLYPLS